jgi:hypothetical protein
MHTVLVNPINKGVFSLTWVAGGRFQDGIFGKAFLDCIEFASGKLSSIGGGVFSFVKSLYRNSCPSFSTLPSIFTSSLTSGGGGLFWPTGATTFDGSETCVHRKCSEKRMHKATQKVGPLQNRLGIIATGCAFDAADGNKKNREAATPEVKGHLKGTPI